MGQDLLFSIDQEIRNKETVLILNIAEKGSSRTLNFSDLQKMEPKELLLFLQKQKCKEVGLPLNSPAAAGLNYNTIRIKASQSLETVQKLILAKKLLWKERTLFFNPLSKVSVELEAESIGDGLIVSATLILDGKNYPFSSIDFFFYSEEENWGICKQMVFVLPRDMDVSWVKTVYPESRILEGKERFSFIHKYKEDPPTGFPKTVWKGDFQEGAIEKELPVYPFLTLKDRYGAFADLGMEYEDKKIDFTDAKRFPGRNLSGERSWEKDLLETDFIKKPLAGSNYYCPTDKVAKSISFLLDIGWKIFDVRGRELTRLSAKELTLHTEGRNLSLRGSFTYKDHTVNIADVVGAFNRKEKFLELSSTAVAWLEGDDYQGMEDLVQSERVGDSCILSKRQFGLLEGFKDLAPKDRQSKSLLDRLLERGQLTQEEDPSFQGTLWPYQQEGRNWLSFLYQNGFSGLLADEMGLGKTVQTLAFLSKVSADDPILLVAPTSLVFNWKKEWEKFLPHKKLHVHEGPFREGKEFLQSQEAIITSYAYLRIDQALFSSGSFSCIVLDEAQWIKNPESQIAKACFSLKSSMRICLTGTPIENRADDLWSLFHFLEPELLGERQDFLSTLSSSSHDERYRERIRKKIRPFLLRRRKEEVLQDLPEKLEQVIWVEMKEKQKDFYDDFITKTRKGLLQKIAVDGASSHRMEILESVLRLRQICCDPLLVDSEITDESAKVERVLQDLTEAVAQQRKVLLYSQFTKMLKTLEKKIRELGFSYEYLDGETKDREQAVQSFQENPDVSIFLISLKAGGVGLNLTAADYVFLFDPWWNEAVEKQAIDRAHRIGRKDKVVARRYIVSQSIEEKMMKLKEYKESLAKGLLDFEHQESEVLLEQMVELLRE